MTLVAKSYVEERNGGYYVANTRISLDSIVQCFQEGLTPEAINAEFDTLSAAQVFGAIAFYLENKAHVDTYLIKQQQRFEAQRREAPPLPRDLRKRLLEARQSVQSGSPD